MYVYASILITGSEQIRIQIRPIRIQIRPIRIQMRPIRDYSG